MNNKPYIALFISIVSVSFAAIFIRLVDADPLSIAFYRLLFTFLLILPFAIFRKKIREELIKIPLKTLLIMTGIGVVLAAPVLASLVLISRYTSRKMLDLDPFPDPESEDDPVKFNWENVMELVRRIRGRFKRKQGDPVDD